MIFSVEFLISTDLSERKLKYQFLLNLTKIDDVTDDVRKGVRSSHTTWSKASESIKASGRNLSHFAQEEKQLSMRTEVSLHQVSSF